MSDSAETTTQCAECKKQLPPAELAHEVPDLCTKCYKHWQEAIDGALTDHRLLDDPAEPIGI